MNVLELVTLAAQEQRSQRQLAHKLNVHEDMVSHWPAARRMMVFTKHKLAPECKYARVDAVAWPLCCGHGYT